MGEHLGGAHAPRRGSSYEAIFFSDNPMTPNTRCRHRFAGVCTVIVTRVEGGHAARCLLCDAVGPVRGNGVDARHVLLNQKVGDEE